ncbi:MAG TPA: calcium-binding protein [Rubrivivax sp.]|nr:calcium-binding protein [Rubrivivax sp.]
MATMFADLAFDYRNLNLNRLIANQTDFEFADNVNYAFGGISYQDVVYFEHYSGGYVGTFFGGTGVKFTSDYSKVTAGTVTGYYEEYWSGTAWRSGWAVQNFTYSAVSLAEAAYTSSTADDYAAIASILSGNDSISLSPYADIMRGYGGNDLINGNSGNDLLYGDAGADTLNGGSGADTMLGGAGNDTYVVDNISDRVYETTTVGGTVNAGGIDTVRSSVSYTLGSFVEKLVLTGSNAINGSGNSLANSITGNSANNLLSGGSGNDTLSGGAGNDTLNGGSGADTMLGGAGNDTYVVDNRGDKVYETTTVGGTVNAGGTDTVRSSVSYTLGSFVEKLVLTGSGAINGAGNTLANTITGNSANNLLAGGSGNDTLSGGAGNDTLVGGNGNDSLSGGTGLDVFRFNTALSATSNVDRIVDFIVADDTIQLDNAVFSSLTTTGSLGPGQLRAGAGVTRAADANDFVLYNASTGALYYDADGSGAASAPLQFATLGTGLALTAADFYVI